MSQRYGPPEVVRVVADAPVPGVGADDLLVRVHATTVNRTDCAYRGAHPFVMRGMTGLRRPRVEVWGTEYAGVVERVGREVTRFAPGDEVFGYAEGRFGAHAELVAVGATSTRRPGAARRRLRLRGGGDGGGALRAVLDPARRHPTRSACARARRHRRHRLGGGDAPRRPRGARDGDRADRPRRAGAAARGRARHRPRDPRLHQDGADASTPCSTWWARAPSRPAGGSSCPAASTSRPTWGRSRRTSRCRSRPGCHAGEDPAGRLPVPDGDARGARVPARPPGERGVPPGDRPHLSARGHRRGVPVRRERSQGRQRRHRGPPEAVPRPIGTGLGPSRDRPIGHCGDAGTLRSACGA